MSIEALKRAWEADVPGVEKLVLLCLADHANDAGECWPGITRIAQRCGLDQRTVLRKLAELEESGRVTRQVQRGKVTRYRLNPWQGVTGGTKSLVTGSTRTRGSLSPDPWQGVHHNSHEPLETERVARKRATPLPVNFELTLERRLVAEAQRVDAERTFAKFCNHWWSRKACKPDWDAEWLEWCLREPDFSGRASVDPIEAAKQRAESTKAVAMRRETERATAIGCPLKPWPADSADTFATRVHDWEREHDSGERPPPRFPIAGQATS